MSITSVSVIGVDPGLVDTGIRRLFFDPLHRTITVSAEVLTRAAADEIASAVTLTFPFIGTVKVFIEGYRPRSHLNTDARMVALVSDVHKLIPHSKVINNTGIKKVVKPGLMSLLKLDTSPVPTHHNDIVSAGRIALLGMLKDPELNLLLTTVVVAHVEGDPWTVIEA